MSDIPLEIHEAVNFCSWAGPFGEWRVVVRMDGERPFLQVRDDNATCFVTGEPTAWSGRKWFLSPHMTRSEIVQTVWKALFTALEHEAREAFRYCGETIFDPHLDVDALVRFRRSVPLSERPDGMEG